MRRLSAGILALGLFVQMGASAAAVEAVPQQVVLSTQDAEMLRNQIDLLRALGRTAPVQDAAGRDATAGAVGLLEAVEAAAVVDPSKQDANPCVITYVNRVLNTFQSIYYYWISYPFFGIAEVEWGAQVMVQCLLKR